MLTYSQVEAVLAQIHFIDSDKMGAFRGRIKHFQRIGIVPASPGRGKKISYEIQDLLVWAYGLELAQFGIDPTVIKDFLKSTAIRFFDAFEKVDQKNHEIYLLLMPNIMTAAIYENTELLDNNLKCSSVSAFTIDSEKGLGAVVMNETLPHRMQIINVTMLKRQLEASLKNVGGVPADLLKNFVYNRRPDYVSP